MLDLSIIIVNWNAREFLLDCLRSLERETSRPGMEIIVVDNASSDGSVEAIRREFSRLKVVRNRANLGFAKAGNIGIRHGAGRYLMFVNSDVRMVPGCIDRMYRHMEAHPAIGILGPAIVNADNELQPSCTRFPGLWNTLCRALAVDRIFPGLSRYPTDGRTRCVDALSGCLWMIRSEALSRVGLLDERFFMYAEDIDWCKRFWEAGYEVVHFPGARVIHHGGASSALAPVKFYLEMQRANWSYWKKHHAWPAQAAFLFISLLHHLVRIVCGTVCYPFMPSARHTMRLKITRSLACLELLLPVTFTTAIRPGLFTSGTTGPQRARRSITAGYHRTSNEPIRTT